MGIYFGNFKVVKNYPIHPLPRRCILYLHIELDMCEHLHTCIVMVHMCIVLLKKLVVKSTNSYGQVGEGRMHLLSLLFPERFKFSDVLDLNFRSYKLSACN